MGICGSTTNKKANDAARVSLILSLTMNSESVAERARFATASNEAIGNAVEISRTLCPAKAKIYNSILTIIHGYRQLPAEITLAETHKAREQVYRGIALGDIAASLAIIGIDLLPTHLVRIAMERCIQEIRAIGAQVERAMPESRAAYKKHTASPYIL
jgi:hypothetical protein